jgi:hypothetical protein
MLAKREKILLAIILLIGAILRIHNYWDFSLSNDELSALARLHYTSFSELLHEGIKIDGHPAAAQVVLWYVTKWFGNGVAVVRLPFVLAGILSVYFMFRLAQEWLSTSAGLLTAAVFASLEFSLIYSRIARPYALGMLFVLMAATFWIRIVKGRNRPSDLFWLSISLALCAYSHYFAALVAFVLAFAGTFLIKGKNLKLYLMALLAAFILYLPYIPFFLHQLSLGGVGQWLGPPENDWLWTHIRFIFNDSIWLLVIVLLVSVSGIFIFRTRKGFVGHILPLILFLVPFLVGFAYSKWVNPVLQHSTLLFSMPFLLIFLFSTWNDDRPKWTMTLAIVMLSLTTFSSIRQKNFFGTDHFGVFKELAQHMVDWNRESEGNALLVGDFNYPFYLHYYTDRIEPIELALYRTTDDAGLAHLKSMVDTSTRNFVIYAWSTVNQSPEVEAIIQAKFPIEVKRESYFNSEAVMFKKGESPVAEHRFNFEKTDVWNFNPDAVVTDSLGLRSIHLSAENPYGPTFTASISDLFKKGYTSVYVKVKCASVIDGSEIQIVYEQTNVSGGYVWESDAFSRQFNSSGPMWGVFEYSLKEARSDEDVLKIYPWLPNGEPVKLESIELDLR